MLAKEMIGTRIFNELKQKGFSGSQSSVDRYLQKIRKTSDLGSKMSTRFETEPGKQMQYDWKEWELQVGEITKKIYIHSLILSFTQFYQLSDIAAVLEECIAMSAFHKNTVKRLLAAKPLRVAATTLLSIPVPSAPISRPLSVYKAVAHV